MGEIKQIRLCGLGGQGIVLGGTILGHAGISDGKWVAGSSSYGSEARGSACRAEVIISDEPIIFPHVTRPDILIAMSQEAYDKYIKDMGRACPERQGILRGVYPERDSSVALRPQNDKKRRDEETVIYDEQMVRTEEISGLRQLGFPAGSVAIKELENKLVANMVILGIVAEVTGIVSQNALLSAIEENVPERFNALNLRAAELGLQLGRAKE